MELIYEQRVCVKFCFRLGKTATETLYLLRTAFGEDAMSRGTCYEWHRRFKEGRVSVKDDDRPGRPSTSKTEEKVYQVREVIRTDGRLTVREVAQVVGLSYGSCQDLLSNVLGISRIAGKFVPRVLSEEHKESRLEMARELLVRVEMDPDFLDRIITGDQSWVYGYDVAAEADAANAAAPKKSRQVKSGIKAMIVTFFDSRGMVHHEWVPAGQPVNGHYYLEVLKRLHEAVRRNRPDAWNDGSWMLHHDETPSRASLQISHFLAENRITLVPQPQYSPDLVPCDFFLFPKLKSSVKGRRFDSVDGIRVHLEADIRAIPETAYKECFRKWKRRWQLCMAAAGDYIEGDDFSLLHT